MIYIVNMILMVLIGIMLFGAGIADIKSLHISRRFIVAFVAVCILALASSGEISLIASLAGALIGICAIGICLASSGQIGMADGIVITAIGLVTQFRGCLMIVCVASLVMCIIAIAVLILKKGDKKTKLPFIPALFAGYSLYLVNMFVIGV